MDTVSLTTAQQLILCSCFSLWCEIGRNIGCSWKGLWRFHSSLEHPGSQDQVRFSHHWTAIITNQCPKLPFHTKGALLIFMDPLCFMPLVSCHALVVLVHKLECNMLMSNSILLECKDLPISLIYPALKLIQNSLTSEVLEAKCSL